MVTPTALFQEVSNGNNGLRWRLQRHTPAAAHDISIIIITSK